MATAQNTQTVTDIDAKIAAFDAMFDEDEDDSEILSPSQLASEAQDDGDISVVAAMQDLLLRHEASNAHRVEDPELVRVLTELRHLAHSNIADVFETESVLEYVGQDDNEKDVYKTNHRMRVRSFAELPREVTACIQSVKVTPKPEGDVIEVRMYDKQVSIDKLMRFHGAYVRDNQQTQGRSDGIMDLLLSSIGSSGLPVLINNDA